MHSTSPPTAPPPSSGSAEPARWLDTSLHLPRDHVQAACRWAAGVLLGALMALPVPARAETTAPSAGPETAPAPSGQVELDSPLDALDLPPPAVPTLPVEELLFTYAFPGLSDDEARQFIEDRAAFDPREIELNYPLIDRIIRDPGPVWIATPDGERVQFSISRPCRARMALTSCSGWSVDRHDLLTFGVTADRQSAYLTLLRNGNYRTEKLPDGRLVLFRIDWTRLSRPQ